jgi:hypothetical protein
MKNPYSVLHKYEGQYLQYPELCRLIGEEPKQGGKAKRLHLNRIKQYVDLMQENRKIYIGRVYEDDDELQIIENHGKFTTYIRQFLINLFYELGLRTGQTSVVMTNRDILEMTCMVNNNYFIGKNAPYKYLNEFNLSINREDMPSEEYISNKIIDESDIFFSSSYRLLKRVVYDSLTSMEKSSLINKNKTFRLYKNSVDEHGRFHSTQRDCDDEDIARILTAQHDAIVEFNLDAKERHGADTRYHLPNIQCVHYLYPSERKRFYAILNAKIKEEFKEEGWNAYSVAWKITLAKSRIFEDELATINYRRLNENVQDKLLSAKDLSLIEDTLKKQFVNTFIRVRNI